MTGTRQLAIDIGGANIKLASSKGHRSETAFPLWRDPEQLVDVLHYELSKYPDADTILAVMTGELADCYPTREAGVRSIATALQHAAGPKNIWWFGLDGAWHPSQTLHSDPARFAASNWLALATFVGQCRPDQGCILLDIGSTTTDIIPISNGKPASRGRTDTERLAHSELVYVGIERTPICAIVEELPYRGRMIPVAAEWFATTLDAWLALESTDAPTESPHTADGREATRAAAQRRLARTVLAIGEDEFTDADAHVAAREIEKQVVAKIGAALTKVVAASGIDAEQTILAGSGIALGRRVLRSLGAKQEAETVSQLFGLPSANVCTAMALLRVWNRRTAQEQP